jgi:hypothetical protein
MNVLEHSSAIDEIRSRCAQLVSEDFDANSATYLWLRDSAPFCRVLGRFREHDLPLYDLAVALAPYSRHRFAWAAVRVLREELATDDFCANLLTE